MSWEIKYTDKWTGKETTKTHSHNRANAEGWTENLARDNNCKAECYRVNDDGSRTHVVSHGDNSK